MKMRIAPPAQSVIAVADPPHHRDLRQFIGAILSAFFRVDITTDRHRLTVGRPGKVEHPFGRLGQLFGVAGGRRHHPYLGGVSVYRPQEGQLTAVRRQLGRSILLPISELFARPVGQVHQHYPGTGSQAIFVDPTQRIGQKGRIRGQCRVGHRFEMIDHGVLPDSGNSAAHGDVLLWILNLLNLSRKSQANINCN